jgi:hypothetical protein
MKLPVMTVEFYLIGVKDWQVKRKLLIDILESVERKQYLDNGFLAPFHTDRSINTYKDKVSEIFAEEIRQIEKETECELVVNDVWSVGYGTGDFHPPHNHADSNFSAVLYFDFDPSVHTGTSIILQTLNPKKNMTDIITPDVSEGNILVFPSQLLHYTAPNRSDRKRGIVSFDLKVISWL